MDEFFTDIEDMERGDYSAVASIPEDFDFELPKSRVYILTDEENKVVRIEGEYSLPSDLTDWILIDEGYGDKYNLAQSHYLEKPLVADDGTHNYCYEDGMIREATEEERETERASFPEPLPTLEDRVAEHTADIEALQLENAMLTEAFDLFIEDIIPPLMKE